MSGVWGSRKSAIEFGGLQNGSCPLPFLPNGRDSVQDVLNSIRLSNTRALTDIWRARVLDHGGGCQPSGQPSRILYFVTGFGTLFDRIDFDRETSLCVDV